MSSDDNPLETDDLIRRAQTQGWVAERHTGIVLLRSPGVATIVTASDDGDPRAVANALSRLRRGGFDPGAASPSVPGHTVEVDTRPGVTHSEEDLLHVATLLDRAPEAILPALSLDTTSGTIGATFQVSGDDVPEAAQNAAVAFAHALILAGLEVPHDLGTVRIVDAAASAAAPGAPAEPGHRATGATG
jgi:hypothetical protein